MFSNILPFNVLPAGVQDGGIVGGNRGLLLV